jgi:hypothetical protein
MASTVVFVLHEAYQNVRYHECKISDFMRARSQMNKSKGYLCNVALDSIINLNITDLDLDKTLAWHVWRVKIGCSILYMNLTEVLPIQVNHLTTWQRPLFWFQSRYERKIYFRYPHVQKGSNSKLILPHSKFFGVRMAARNIVEGL